MGIRILMVVAPKNFRDEEFMIPKQVFESSGFEVIVASKGVKQATGMFGVTAEVDKDLRYVDAADYEVIVFVGGSGSSIYYEDKIALDLAKLFYEECKVVAAICIAPGILAESGILKGKKATIWASGDLNFIKILEENGA
ncbi:MAG: DJ-1 family protein, partial [Candidatus Aenigmatarchaeota archaeon]